jgi:hypothetical protein
MIGDGGNMDRIRYIAWVNNCKLKGKLVEYRRTHHMPFIRFHKKIG